MKKLLLLIAAAIVLNGCARREPSRRWTTSPDFDARVVVFERACAEGAAADSLSALTAELYARARADSGRRELLAAADYCNAHRLNLLGDRREALRFVGRGLGAVADSAANAYLYHRLAHLKAAVEYSLRHSAAASYRRLKECEEYYASVGDTLSQVRALNSLAKILSDAGLMVECRSYLDEIERHYKELGYARYIYEFNLTKAWLAAAEGLAAEADSIVRFLAADARSRRNPRFYNAVLVSCWEVMRDTADLDSAYRLSRFVHPATMASIELEKAGIAAGRGDTGEAVGLSAAAFGHAAEVGDTALMISVLKTQARLAADGGDTGGALRFTLRRDSLLESQRANSAAATLAAEQLKMDLRLGEERASKQRQRTFYIVMIALLAAFIVASISVALMRSRKQRHDLKELRDKLEIEKKNRLLSLVACSLGEKESLVESFREIIRRACDDGKLTPANARELESSLRLYYSAEEEFTSLAMIHESLPSDFLTRLRAASSVELPQPQVSLAMCIACGLTSKQISRLLKIQPDTVKKNRWKLRSALGLAPDDDLAERLRALLK